MISSATARQPMKSITHAKDRARRVDVTATAATAACHETAPDSVCSGERHDCRLENQHERVHITNAGAPIRCERG
jgi:hypothetical protein